MKALRYLTAVLLLLTAGCSKEEDNTLPNQQRRIISFLTGTLKLRTEAEAKDPSSDTENALFYTEIGGNAYRWIVNYYEADRDQRRAVDQGSVVRLTISAYLFEFRVIRPETVPLLYTNDPKKAQVLENAGLDLSYWTFEPYVLKMGETSAISALTDALWGCREGDQVELYTTYALGYGEKWMYAVDPQSPLALFFTVDAVE